MKNLLLASAAALALSFAASAASAANTALTMWTSGNPGDAVTESGIDGVDIGPQNLGGVTVTLTFANRNTAPNQLTEGNINIDNTSSTSQTLNIIVGANGFTGLAKNFALSGTVLANNGVADFGGSFFVDKGNSLNGLSESVVGADITDFTSGLLSGPHSYSFNGTGSDFLAGPYGMAEALTLTLAPGAEIAVQGVSMVASGVPEPSTWAMGLAGFGALAALGFKRRRDLRSIA
jgi:MYXO-CTERM domain-containing protein